MSVHNDIIPEFEEPSLFDTQSARTYRLATRCLACDRPLCDATSVSLGIGPDCRKRLCPGNLPNNAVANLLTAQAAICAEDGQVAAVLAIADQLRILGYDKLAEKVYDRFVDIRISAFDQDSWMVKTPYDPLWNEVCYKMRLGRWNPLWKGRVVRKDRRVDLWEALKQVYPGRQGMREDGKVFTIAGRV